MLVECWCHLPIVPTLSSPSPAQNKGPMFGETIRARLGTLGRAGGCHTIVHTPPGCMKLEGVTAFKIRACPGSMEIMELHKNCWESCGTMHRWTALDLGGNIESIHSMEHSGQRGGVQICRTQTTGPIHRQGLVNNFHSTLSSALVLGCDHQ